MENTRHTPMTKKEEVWFDFMGDDTPVTQAHTAAPSRPDRAFHFAVWCDRKDAEAARVQVGIDRRARTEEGDLR